MPIAKLYIKYELYIYIIIYLGLDAYCLDMLFDKLRKQSKKEKKIEHKPETKVIYYALICNHAGL